jgi:hypothetical protein
MFDVLLHGSTTWPSRALVARALGKARFRVLPVQDQQPPQAMQALRVDVAVDCPESPHAAARGAATLSAELDGPPPVVSVASNDAAQAALAGGASEVLSPGVDDLTLSSHIVRLATDRKRRRRQLVLQGLLDDLGLDALFEAVVRRGHEARIVLRSQGHQATLVTDGRAISYTQVDGQVGPPSTLEQVRAWPDVRFELWVRPMVETSQVTLRSKPAPPAVSSDTPSPAAAPSAAPSPAAVSLAAPSSAAVSSTASSSAPPSQRWGATAVLPPRATPAEGALSEKIASEVALACTILNAATAFALASLPPARVTTALTRSLVEASARHPGLSGFSVTREGRASVSSLSRAANALPDGLAHWLGLFLDECEREAPGRFAAVELDQILGGLQNMVRHAGWYDALRPSRRSL